MFFALIVKRVSSLPFELFSSTTNLDDDDGPVDHLGDVAARPFCAADADGSDVDELRDVPGPEFEPAGGVEGDGEGEDEEGLHVAALQPHRHVARRGHLKVPGTHTDQSCHHPISNIQKRAIQPNLMNHFIKEAVKLRPCWG